MRWNDDPELATHLRARFLAWMDCNRTGDMTTLATFIHPDFRYVTAFGHQYRKDSYIDLASSLVAGAYYEIHRMEARSGGDVAEVDGEYYTRSITSAGDDLTAHTRFTGCWVLHDGEWLCLTHHGTVYEPTEELAAVTMERAIAAQSPPGRSDSTALR